jgi:uncharacterized RDD family membrane protein YckC
MTAAAPVATRESPAPEDPRVRTLVTPEGVDLRLVLASAGERAAAFLLDAAIITGVLIAITIAAILVALATHFAPGEMLISIWLLASFFLRNFYFMAFELSPRAATPGKRIVGLRVTARDGGPLSAEAIFARNAMRELEVFLPLSFMASTASSIDAWIAIAGIVWCGVFVLFPLFNRDRMRIGDLVGGTIVVRVPKRILDSDLSQSAAPAGTFTVAALDAYGIKELGVLEDVLRRRDPATVEAVAARIRGKIGVTAREPDLAFLQSYYTALRGRLESRLLFGRRRRDKFDAP